MEVREGLVGPPLPVSSRPLGRVRRAHVLRWVRQPQPSSVPPISVPATSHRVSSHLQGASGVKVMKAFLHPGRHGLLALADPNLPDVSQCTVEIGRVERSTYSRVVLLLVGLVGALGVADLGLEIVDVIGDVVTVLVSAQRWVPGNSSPEKAYRMPVRYVHCRSVSTLTLTTPCFCMSV